MSEILWQSHKKQELHKLIRNSASICTDVMINADVTILPATQPTQVSDSLKKLHLYNNIIWASYWCDYR